jgi:predicted TIM-barrel fold metal-dependent hydrolase
MELDEYFKIDVECHLVGDMEPVSYFPGVKMWWRAIQGITRPLFFPLETPPELLKVKNRPEEIIDIMDKYQVDMALLLPESMMDTTGYATRWVTNGYVAAVCKQYPERFIFCPNVGPIKKRGIKNALWELEYLVKEMNAKAVKLYSPEDTYINDTEIYPFYEKCVELKIPVCIHTGFCWVPPGRAKYCHPEQLDDVATDFPDLTIIAYHAGWPYPDVLNMVAATHPNVYIGLNLIMPWALGAPRTFAKIVGEALRWVGPDRIVWGTDFAGLEAQVLYGVEGLKKFQIPKDMQEQYGYPPLKEEDKKKIFGLNLAKILGIKPERRIGKR